MHYMYLFNKKAYELKPNSHYWTFSEEILYLLQ